MVLSPRPLRPSDLDAVATLECVAFSDPWPRSAFVELLRERHIRAFASDGDDGQLEAYALCSVVADEGEILNLAVRPESRRRGVARALLEAMLERMRAEGVVRVFLEVRESNQAALRLYALAGFQPVSLRRRYYRNPTEHAVTMRLDLASETARK